jgi:SAM-dependent methyltransferase
MQSQCNSIAAPKISAFVVTYNRAELLRACLRRAQFVDELIVVDKGSTDRTPQVAAELADQYYSVLWTPVVEDTRALAQSLCSHEWILCLDDDEILCPDAGAVIRVAIEDAPADLLYLPIHHFILGRFDERAYAPEWRPSLYRRGMVHYSTMVHSSPTIAPGCRARGLPGVNIDHLSHPDVAAWIEKANRYTSMPDRCGAPATPNLVASARNRLASLPIGEPHVEAVALLRAVYDIIDMVKAWEATEPSGHEAFHRICQDIEWEAALEKLHVGCGDHPLEGWLNTDLNPCRSDIRLMDATRRFPFADGVFERVFSEHMIEHVPHAGGAAMLAECRRVLRPGGRIRISCPDQQFIDRLLGPVEELTHLERSYVDWACRHFGLASARAVGHNLAAGFGHQHIYNVATLRIALETAGFHDITEHRIRESGDPELCNLENDGRMPPGFLQLETMTLEGVVPS